MFCRVTTDRQLGPHYVIIYGDNFHNIPEGRLEGIMAGIGLSQRSGEMDRIGEAPKMLVIRYVSSRQTNNPFTVNPIPINVPALIAGLEEGAFKDYEI